MVDCVLHGSRDGGIQFHSKAFILYGSVQYGHFECGARVIVIGWVDEADARIS